jgi:alpha-ketoglutarate-dependent taurine dioxygenase
VKGAAAVDRTAIPVMNDDSSDVRNRIAAASSEGSEAEETEALIAALADHIVKPAFIYRHQWRPGDLLMWDNCTVRRRAVQDYDLPQRRLMHRTTMGGAIPF